MIFVLPPTKGYLDEGIKLGISFAGSIIVFDETKFSRREEPA